MRDAGPRHLPSCFVPERWFCHAVIIDATEVHRTCEVLPGRRSNLVNTVRGHPLDYGHVESLEGMLPREHAAAVKGRSLQQGTEQSIGVRDERAAGSKESLAGVDDGGHAGAVEGQNPSEV